MKTHNLLNFSKGKALPKLYMWVVVKYNGGAISCEGKPGMAGIDNDIICLDVSGLTRDQISIFKKFTNQSY